MQFSVTTAPTPSVRAKRLAGAARAKEGANDSVTLFGRLRQWCQTHLNPDAYIEKFGGAPLGGAPMGGAPLAGESLGGAPTGGAPMGGFPLGDFGLGWVVADQRAGKA